MPIVIPLKRFHHNLHQSSHSILLFIVLTPHFFFSHHTKTFITLLLLLLLLLTNILLSPISATLISFIIRMASFWFLLSFIISLIIFPLFSSSTSLITSQPSTIPASPSSSLTNSNSLPLSPFQELSPDIAPLLPSPGGVLPSPTVSSLPTIPSTPSPPNPDDLAALGPDSAFSPLGSFPASSASPQSLVNLAAAVGCTAFCSLQFLKM